VIPSPTLSLGHIHVWSIPLTFPLERLRSSLSPEEIHHSRQFHFERDRTWFRLRHESLRHILGYYTSKAPSEIGFHCNNYGKPRLISQDSIHFSLSHSQGQALCAVAFGRDVGIDLERIRPMAQMEAIVRRHFSSPEQAAFDRAPEDSRPGLFFALWTRKEAYVKARGEGLSCPLESFVVPSQPYPCAIPVPVQATGGSETGWGVADLDAPSGYRAALAAAGTNWSIQAHAFDWNLLQASGC